MGVRTQLFDGLRAQSALGDFPPRRLAFTCCGLDGRDAAALLILPFKWRDAVQPIFGHERAATAM